MLLMTGPKEIRIEDIELCAKGRLQGKISELHRSIQGFYEEHHCFQLTSLMQVIAALEMANDSIDARMRELMQEHNDLIRRMDEVPGINELSAQYVLSELGPDLATFADASALASWTGLCPGNNESAGKRRSGRSPVRKHHLKTIMIEVAWAAVKKKGTYYRDKYWRLRYRLGPKKAIVAIAHRIVKALFFIIKKGEEYRELGDQYLAAKSQKNKLTRIRRDAEELGFNLVPIVVG
jgi:transposase